MSDKPIVVDGVTVNITADDMDDIEILELIADLEQNGAKIVTLLKKVFGEEKYREIKEALRDEETGKTKTSRITEWFGKVSEIVGAGN